MRPGIWQTLFPWAFIENRVLLLFRNSPTNIAETRHPSGVTLTIAGRAIAVFRRLFSDRFRGFLAKNFSPFPGRSSLPSRTFPMIPWLPTAPVFPPVSHALREADGANGLLAAGGDLSPERLVAAYRQGIFPWFSVGEPILWWSPDPRMVLKPDALRITRSLAKTLRNGNYEVCLDSAFADVARACAHTPRPGQRGTWIQPEMQAAYLRMHRLGYAHSVETWIDGELVGGLYGIAIGRAFFGESMFSLRRDASKIALAHLCHYLSQRGFGIIDCQMETAHLHSLGARPMPRSTFVATLETLVDAGNEPFPTPWPQDAVKDALRDASERKGPFIAASAVALVESAS